MAQGVEWMHTNEAFSKGLFGIYEKKCIVRVENAYDFTKSYSIFEPGREAEAFKKAEAIGLFFLP